MERSEDGGSELLPSTPFLLRDRLRLILVCLASESAFISRRRALARSSASLIFAKDRALGGLFSNYSSISARARRTLSSILRSAFEDRSLSEAL